MDRDSGPGGDFSALAQHFSISYLSLVKSSCVSAPHWDSDMLCSTYGTLCLLYNINMDMTVFAAEIDAIIGYNGIKRVFKCPSGLASANFPTPEAG